MGHRGVIVSRAAILHLLVCYGKKRGEQHNDGRYRDGSQQRLRVATPMDGGRHYRGREHVNKTGTT